MKITSISKYEIPGFPFEGYLWKSNSSSPEIIDNRLVTPSELEDLPFVVEGLLFSEKERVSIRIVHLDGHYRIARMDLSEIPDEFEIYQLDKIKFIDKQALKLYQHFELLPDPVFPDNETWQPTWSAFIGFKS